MRSRLCSGPSRPHPTRVAKGSEVMQIFNQLFPFSKLLVVVLGPVSVKRLVSVEVAPSARLACYGMKINVLICLWF